MPMTHSDLNSKAMILFAGGFFIAQPRFYLILSSE
jgi:hypothetical protein